MVQSCPTLRPHGLQHARLPCPSPTPRACPNSCPSSQWCHPTSFILYCPLLLLPSVSPSIRSFQMSQFFATGGQSIGVLALASVLPKNTRADLLQNGLVVSPCSPRDSQESSPTPQFKSIDSSVLSFLYGPTPTSIHDYWKNHNFDYTNLWWQSNVSF